MAYGGRFTVDTNDDPYDSLFPEDEGLNLGDIDDYLIEHELFAHMRREQATGFVCGQTATTETNVYEQLHDFVKNVPIAVSKKYHKTVQHVLTGSSAEGLYLAENSDVDVLMIHPQLKIPDQNCLFNFLARETVLRPVEGNPGFVTIRLPAHVVKKLVEAFGDGVVGRENMINSGFIASRRFPAKIREELVIMWHKKATSLFGPDCKPVVTEKSASNRSVAVTYEFCIKQPSAADVRSPVLKTLDNLAEICPGFLKAKHLLEETNMDIIKLRKKFPKFSTNYDSDGGFMTMIPESANTSVNPTEVKGLGHIASVTSKVELPGCFTSFATTVMSQIITCSQDVQNLKKVQYIAGPMYEVKSSHKVMGSVDFVFAFECDGWPAVASEWKSRKRNWPPKSVVTSVTKSGYHVVPKVAEDELAWRISFSKAETELSKSMTPIQKQGYKIAKALFYKYMYDQDATPVMHPGSSASVITKAIPFNPSFPKLTSYYLKTIFLYYLEETEPYEWEEYSLPRTLGMFFYKLHKCLLSGCPHYFIPQIDLMDSFTDEDIAFASTIAEILRSLLLPF